MKRKISRAESLQNATAMFLLAITKNPNRGITIDNGRCGIDLKLFFDSSEKDAMHEMEKMLKRCAMRYAKFSENYFKDNDFYCIKFQWEVDE